jgi:hypothetical protein
MAGLITLADLLAWPGFDSVDSGQASKLIDVASGLVRDVAKPVDIDALDPLPPAVEGVVVSMVRRALDNPRGLSGEQLGDYQWQAQGNQSAIYPTRNEKRVIRRAVGKLGVGTVQLEADVPLPPESPAFGLVDPIT